MEDNKQPEQPNKLLLGGRTITLRPASLKTIKRWMVAQDEVRVGTREYLDEVSAFVCSTLVRSDPSLTVEWIEEELDEHTIPVVLSKIYACGRIGSGETERPQSD